MDDVSARPIQLSVYERAVDEIQRYKWIESEKAGYDLGQGAVRRWVREHWSRFLRERWLEHLEGRIFWAELDHDDFGLLGREFPDPALVGVIHQRIKTGGENLDILCWAVEEHLPNEKLDHLIDLLETLDMNARRLDYAIDSRLSQTG